jgi:hypothetical protein
MTTRRHSHPELEPEPYADPRSYPTLPCVAAYAGERARYLLIILLILHRFSFCSFSMNI